MYCLVYFVCKKNIHVFTAYPSLMPLGAWILDLIERFNYFTVWSNKLQPPVLFWLGAFTYPTSFLTAVLQANIYH